MTRKDDKKSTDNSTKQELEKIREELNEIIENEQIELAAIVFKVKDLEEPQIIRKGHFYDAASLMNHILNAYRAKAAVDLGMQ